VHTVVNFYLCVALSPFRWELYTMADPLRPRERFYHELGVGGLVARSATELVPDAKITEAERLHVEFEKVSTTQSPTDALRLDLKNYWDDPWDNIVFVSDGRKEYVSVNMNPGEYQAKPEIQRAAGRKALKITDEDKVVFGGYSVTENAGLPDGLQWLPELQHFLESKWQGQDFKADQYYRTLDYISHRMHINLNFSYKVTRPGAPRVLYVRPILWVPYFLHFYALPVFALQATEAELEPYTTANNVSFERAKGVIGKYIACPRPTVRVASTNGVDADRILITMVLRGHAGDIRKRGNRGGGSLWMFFAPPRSHTRTTPENFFAGQADRAVRIRWRRLSKPVNGKYTAEHVYIVRDASLAQNSTRVRLTDGSQLQFAAAPDEAGGMSATLMLTPEDLIEMTRKPDGSSLNGMLMEFLAASPLGEALIAAPPRVPTNFDEVQDQAEAMGFDIARYSSVTDDRAVMDNTDGIMPPVCAFMAHPDVSLNGADRSGPWKAKTCAVVSQSRPAPRPVQQQVAVAQQGSRPVVAPAPANLPQPPPVAPQPTVQPTSAERESLEREITALRTEVDALRDSLAQKTTELGNANALIGTIRLELTDAQNNVVAWSKHADDLKVELENAQEQLRSHRCPVPPPQPDQNAIVEQLRAEVETLQATLRAVTDERDAAQTRELNVTRDRAEKLADKSRELDAVRADLDAARADLDAARAALSQQVEEKAAVSTQLTEKELEIAAAVQRATNAQNAVTAANATVAEEQRARQECNAKVRELEDEVERLKSNLGGHGEDVAAMAAAVAALTRTREELRDVMQTIPDMQRKMDTMVEEMARVSASGQATVALERRIRGMQETIASLHVLAEQHTREHEAMRADVQTLAQNNATHHDEIVRTLAESRRAAEAGVDMEGVMTELQKLQREHADIADRVEEVAEQLARGMPRIPRPVTASSREPPSPSDSNPPPLTPLPRGIKAVPQTKDVGASPPRRKGKRRAKSPEITLPTRAQRGPSVSPGRSGPDVSPIVTRATKTRPPQPIRMPTEDTGSSSSSDESDSDDEANPFSPSPSESGDSPSSSSSTGETSPSPSPEAETTSPSVSLVSSVSSDVDEFAPQTLPPWTPTAERSGTWYKIPRKSRDVSAVHEFPWTQFMERRVRDAYGGDQPNLDEAFQNLVERDQYAREMEWRVFTMRVAGLVWGWYARKGSDNLGAAAMQVFDALEGGGIVELVRSFANAVLVLGLDWVDVARSLEKYLSPARESAAWPVNSLAADAMMVAVLGGYANYERASLDEVVWLATSNGEYNTMRDAASAPGTPKVVFPPRKLGTAIDLSDCAACVMALSSVVKLRLLEAETSLAAAYMLVHTGFTGANAGQYTDAGTSDILEKYSEDYQKHRRSHDYYPGAALEALKAVPTGENRESRTVLLGAVGLRATKSLGEKFPKPAKDAQSVVETVQKLARHVFSGPSVRAFGDIVEDEKELKKFIAVSTWKHVTQMLTSAVPPGGGWTLAQFAEAVDRIARSRGDMTVADLTAMDDASMMEAENDATVTVLASAAALLRCVQDTPMVPSELEMWGADVVFYESDVLCGVYLAYALYRASNAGTNVTDFDESTVQQVKSLYKNLVRRETFAFDDHGNVGANYIAVVHATAEKYYEVAGASLPGNVSPNHPVAMATAILAGLEQPEPPGTPEISTPDLRLLLRTDAERDTTEWAPEELDELSVTPVSQILPDFLLPTAVSDENADAEASAEELLVPYEETEASASLGVVSTETAVPEIVQESAGSAALREDSPIAIATRSSVPSAFAELCASWDAYVEDAYTRFIPTVREYAAYEERILAATTRQKQPYHVPAEHYRAALEHLSQWAKTADEIQYLILVSYEHTMGDTDPETVPIAARRGHPEFLEILRYRPWKTGNRVLSEPEVAGLNALEQTMLRDDAPDAEDYRSRYDRFADAVGGLREGNVIEHAASGVARLHCGTRIVMKLVEATYVPPDMRDAQARGSVFESGNALLVNAASSYVGDLAPGAYREHILAADRLVALVHDEIRTLESRVITRVKRMRAKAESVYEVLPNLVGPVFMSYLVPDGASPRVRMEQWTHILCGWVDALKALDSARDAAERMFVDFYAIRREVASVRTMFSDQTWTDTLAWADDASIVLRGLASEWQDKVDPQIAQLADSMANAHADTLAAQYVQDAFLNSIAYYAGGYTPTFERGEWLPRQHFFLHTLLTRATDGIRNPEFGLMRMRKTMRGAVHMRFLLVDVHARAQTMSKLLDATRRTLTVDLYERVVLGSLRQYPRAYNAADGRSVPSIVSEKAASMGTDWRRALDALLRDAPDVSGLPVIWHDIDALREYLGEMPPPPAVVSAEESVVARTASALHWVDTIPTPTLRKVLASKMLPGTRTTSEDTDGIRRRTDHVLQNIPKWRQDARKGGRPAASETAKNVAKALSFLGGVVAVAPSGFPGHLQFNGIWTKLAEDAMRRKSWPDVHRPTRFATAILEIVQSDVFKMMSDAEVDYVAIMVANYMVSGGKEDRATKERQVESLSDLRYIAVALVDHMNNERARSKITPAVFLRAAQAPPRPHEEVERVAHEFGALFGETGPARAVGVLEDLRLRADRVDVFIGGKGVLAAFQPVTDVSVLSELAPEDWATLGARLKAIAENVRELANRWSKPLAPGIAHPNVALLSLWKKGPAQAAMEGLFGKEKLDKFTGFVLRALLPFLVEPHNTATAMWYILDAWFEDTYTDRPNKTDSFAEIVLAPARQVSATRYYGWPRWVRLLAAAGDRPESVRDALAAMAHTVVLETGGLVGNAEKGKQLAEMLMNVERTYARGADNLGTLISWGQSNPRQLKLHAAMRMLPSFVGVLRTGDLVDYPLTGDASLQRLAVHCRQYAVEQNAFGPADDATEDRLLGRALGEIYVNWEDQDGRALFWPGANKLENGLAMALVARGLSNTRAINDEWGGELIPRLVRACDTIIKEHGDHLEAYRARTNAFAWDMLLHYCACGQEGLELRVLALRTGTDAVWCVRGHRVKSSATIVDVVETGLQPNRAGRANRQLPNHHNIAEAIGKVYRAVGRLRKATAARDQARFVLLSDVEATWRQMEQKMWRAMQAGLLPLSNYKSVSHADKVWFLEGFITSMYLSDVSGSEFRPRNRDWFDAVTRLAGELDAPPASGPSSSRARAEAEIPAPPPASEEPRDTDAVERALLAPVPSERVPHMRAAPRGVSFAPHPTTHVVPVGHRAPQRLLWTGEPEREQASVQFTARRSGGQFW